MRPADLMTIEPHKSRIARLAGAATVLLIFAAIAIPAIFLSALFTENYDEAKYHLPVIRRFAVDLPYPNLRNYSSATTPLYHLIFALLMRLGCSLTTLRLINFAISIATVLIVIVYLRRASDSRSGWLLYSAALLFASSIYVVGPSIRLTTDNMALGCAIAILYLLDRDEKLSPKSFALAIALATVAALTRQLYLWIVPMLVLYALSNKQWTTTRKLTAGGAATLPLLAVLPLFLLWHGFTNSSFAHQHELRDSILNGKAFVLAVCTLGLFAAVFGPSIAQVLMLDARGRVLLLVTFALALTVLPALGANAGSYRVPMEGGWLRAMAEHTPVVFHIWSLFWLLFPLGCVVIAAMSYHAVATRREVWILVALVLWLLLNVMQARAMAKYYEPFEIVVVSRFAVSAPSRWWMNIPVWALTAVFVVVDIFRFWFGSGWASPGFG